MQEGSDDAVLGQLVQLQVIEGLPRANDSDVCKEAQRFVHGQVSEDKNS